MNTKQLVALWYAVLVVLVFLFGAGWGIKGLSSNESAQFTIGALIFGALVIFTLKSSNQLDKKMFLKWMSLPAVLLLALLTLFLYHEITYDKKTAYGTALPLPEIEQHKVTGEAGLKYGTSFAGKLYNGSNYNLKKVVITITAKEKSGAVRWERKFEDDIFITPFKTGEFRVEVIGADGADLNWRIERIEGYKDASLYKEEEKKNISRPALDTSLEGTSFARKKVPSEWEEAPTSIKKGIDFSKYKIEVDAPEDEDKPLPPLDFSAKGTSFEEKKESVSK